MTDLIEKTRAMLAIHHRDGEWFADLMKETYAGRFNEDFWAAWDQFISPIFTDNPVVVDLGTGPGLFLKDIAKRIPGVHAIGIECAPWMLDSIESLPPGCEIINDDLHDPHLPLADHSVDAVLASVVIHEMNQPVRALQEVYRLLKKGGRFYVMDWVRAPLDAYIENESDESKIFNQTTDVKELEETFVHFMEHNRYSIDDLAWLLEKTGFKVIDKTAIRDGRFARVIAEK